MRRGLAAAAAGLRVIEKLCHQKEGMRASLGSLQPWIPFLEQSLPPDSLVAEAVMVMAAADVDCRRVAEGSGVQVAAEDGGAITGPANLQEDMCKYKLRRE